MSESSNARQNILIGVVAIALAVAIAYWVMTNLDNNQLAQGSENNMGVATGDVQIGAASYTLVDMNGGTLTQDSFPGKYKLVFFGYSGCPDECPLALHTMADAMKKIGMDAEKLQIIFISVDPEHDTPAVLKKYLANFDPRFVGATGTLAQVKVAEDSFRAYASEGDDGVAGSHDEHPDAAAHHDADGDGSEISHSDNIYLLSPQNGLLNVFNDDVDAASLANDIQTVLAAALIPTDGVPTPPADVATSPSDVATTPGSKSRKK